MLGSLAKLWMQLSQTRTPGPANLTPSESSLACLRPIASPTPQVPLKPPSWRLDATTLCQGTSAAVLQPEPGASGLLRMHCPTARDAPDEPAVRAISPYVATLPHGILRTSSKTRLWKGVGILEGPSLQTLGELSSLVSIWRYCKKRPHHES